VVPLALEVLQARDGGAADAREVADGQDHEPRGDRAARLGGDLPGPLVLVPARARHLRPERDVAPQVEAVCDVPEVAQDLRLGGVALAPCPVAQQLGREGVLVVDRLDVAARAGVAVPVPGAAHVVPPFDDAHAEARLAEAVQRVEAGEPRADDEDVEVRHQASGVT
jgi:hypothetical protein